MNLGAWAATGATTANVTVISYDETEESGISGTVTIRAALEVGADGDSLTGEYTFAYVGADGTAPGEAGPGTLTGTRLVVEGPGEPVMTLEELFGAFAGTPEASPVP